MEDAEAEYNAEPQGAARSGVVTRRDALQVAAGAVAFAAIPLSDSQSASGIRGDGMQSHNINLIINGRAHALEVDPRQSILDVLRETLDLTGTKKGCNAG